MERRRATSAERRESRPGRPALVARTLEELRGPLGGVVELPHRMVWQPVELRRFNLDDPYQLRTAYEIILREAIRGDELRSLLNGRTLREVWPDLYLPRGVRLAWEDQHQELAQLRLTD